MSIYWNDALSEEPGLSRPLMESLNDQGKVNLWNALYTAVNTYEGDPGPVVALVESWSLTLDHLRQGALLGQVQVEWDRHQYTLEEFRTRLGH